MIEELRKHPKFIDYAITKTGKVYSIKRKKFMAVAKSGNGHLQVTLRHNKTQYHQRVHRLVLETFVGPCPKGMEACHNNGDKTNNRIENLRWDTHSSNMKDSIKHKTRKVLKGRNNPNAKLTEKDVKLIYSVYWDGAYSQDELVAYFDVAYSTISNIVNTKTWKHIWKN